MENYLLRTSNESKTCASVYASKKQSGMFCAIPKRSMYKTNYVYISVLGFIPIDRLLVFFPGVQSKFQSKKKKKKTDKTPDT